MNTLDALRNLSAEIGADPLLVQAAGGNTSLKQNGVMWIKASGTWLKDAAAKDIFVPVDLARLNDELMRNNPDCDTCLAFVRTDLNPSGLRPSVETTVHAAMPQPVVLHVHCVNTIAHAIRQDAEAVLQEKLKNQNWAYVPYVQPGMTLAAAIKQRLKPETDVLVLGNHGLVVAADTIPAAEEKLRAVSKLLTADARPSPPPRMQQLISTAAGTNYEPARNTETHALATDLECLATAKSVVFYPDHAVFLGTGVATDMSTQAPLVAVPSLGVLTHKSAKTAVEPLGRCLADVLRRVPKATPLKTLTTQEIDAITNWEAEKYRQIQSSVDQASLPSANLSRL